MTINTYSALLSRIVRISEIAFTTVFAIMVGFSVVSYSIMTLFGAYVLGHILLSMIR